MQKISFDGYIPYDDSSFQDLVSDTKAATDGLDVAYEALDKSLQAYIALLDFNANFLIIRDRARLGDFVRKELGGDLPDSGTLPGDEITTAIDAKVTTIIKKLTTAVNSISGQKPHYDFVYNVPVDQGAGSTYGIYLELARDKSKSMAKAMRYFARNRLGAALHAEYRRAKMLVHQLATLDGGTDASALAGDPLADVGRFRKTLDALSSKVQKQHSGLLEFGHYAAQAIEKQPDIRPEEVADAYAVIAIVLPARAKLLAFWRVLFSLSSWTRTGNVLEIKNQAGFVAKARVAFIDNTPVDFTEWTDDFPIGHTREIDLRRNSLQVGHRLQLEVHAELGKTKRSEVFFQSALDVRDPVTVEVTGATLTFSIDFQ